MSGKKVDLDAIPLTASGSDIQRIERIESFSRREDRELPAVPQAASLVQALAIAAADPRTDMDKMERLFAMHERIVAREAEAAFNDAMAKTQAEIQPIVNNAINDHTHSGYAKMEQIDRGITPIHTKFGLSISYDTETKNDADPIPDGLLRTIAIVSHSAGHSRRYHIDLPTDEAGSQGKVNKTGVQARGSSNAYARRYLKLMVFNLSTFDDKDGNKNGSGMSESALADHIAAMEACTTREELQKAFGIAYKAAEALKDQAGMKAIIRGKDVRKAALAAKEAK